MQNAQHLALVPPPEKAAANEGAVPSIYLDGQGPKDAKHRCQPLGWFQAALEEGLPMKEILSVFGPPRR